MYSRSVCATMAPVRVSGVTSSGFACWRPYTLKPASHFPEDPSFLRTPSLKRYIRGPGILTWYPSPTPLGLGLGPTNPEQICFTQETLGFRCLGIQPKLSLLMPAFSLPLPPASLTTHLLRSVERSPTTSVTTY